MTAILHHAALINATAMAVLLAISLVLHLLRNLSSAPAEAWHPTERTRPPDL